MQGTLPFNDTLYGSGAATSLDPELWVAPAPIRPSKGGDGANDANAEHAWLPLYFAAPGWRCAGSWRRWPGRRRLRSG